MYLSNVLGHILLIPLRSSREGKTTIAIGMSEQRSHKFSKNTHLRSLHYHIILPYNFPPSIRN